MDLVADERKNDKLRDSGLRCHKSIEHLPTPRSAFRSEVKASHLPRLSPGGGTPSTRLRTRPFSLRAPHSGSVSLPQCTRARGATTVHHLSGPATTVRRARTLARRTWRLQSRQEVPRFCAAVFLSFLHSDLSALLTHMHLRHVCVHV